VPAEALGIAAQRSPWRLPRPLPDLLPGAYGYSHHDPPNPDRAMRDALVTVKAHIALPLHWVAFARKSVNARAGAGNAKARSLSAC